MEKTFSENSESHKSDKMTEAERAKDVRDRLEASYGQGSHYDWDEGMSRVGTSNEAAALLDEMRRLIRAQLNAKLHFFDGGFTERTIHSLADVAAKRLGCSSEEILSKMQEQDTSVAIKSYREQEMA